MTWSPFGRSKDSNLTCALKGRAADAKRRLTPRKGFFIFGNFGEA
jgi:hypothetical protein